MRFTIRELLLTILAFGLGLGWWLDHHKQEWRLTRVYFAVAGHLGLHGMGVQLTPDTIRFDDGDGWQETMPLTDVMAQAGILESRTWRDAWREQSKR
jgi:hypothetical protein